MKPCNCKRDPCCSQCKGVGYYTDNQADSVAEAFKKSLDRPGDVQIKRVEINKVMQIVQDDKSIPKIKPRQPGLFEGDQ